MVILFKAHLKMSKSQTCLWEQSELEMPLFSQSLEYTLSVDHEINYRIHWDPHFSSVDTARQIPPCYVPLRTPTHTLTPNTQNTAFYLTLNENPPNGCIISLLFLLYLSALHSLREIVQQKKIEQHQ